MMKKVLIDTDVLLDFFFGRAPFANDTASILQLCKENKLAGYTTPVIIANCYYLLRKTASHDFVIDKLNQLLGILEVAEMNRQVVINALNSKFKDFEDALQNFTADNTKGISIIITRNTKDFKQSKLAVFTPTTFLKSLE